LGKTRLSSGLVDVVVSTSIDEFADGIPEKLMALLDGTDCVTSDVEYFSSMEEKSSDFEAIKKGFEKKIAIEKKKKDDEKARLDEKIKAHLFEMEKQRQVAKEARDVAEEVESMLQKKIAEANEKAQQMGRVDQAAAVDSATAKERAEQQQKRVDRVEALCAEIAELYCQVAIVEKEYWFSYGREFSVSRKAVGVVTLGVGIIAAKINRYEAKEQLATLKGQIATKEALKEEEESHFDYSSPELVKQAKKAMKQSAQLARDVSQFNEQREQMVQQIAELREKGGAAEAEQNKEMEGMKEARQLKKNKSMAANAKIQNHMDELKAAEEGAAQWMKRWEALKTYLKPK